MSRSCDYLDFDLGMNSPTSEVYLDIKIFTRSCFLSNINESEPIKIMRFHFCALFSTLPQNVQYLFCAADEIFLNFFFKHFICG